MNLKIDLEEFNYNLPFERIAQYPLTKRDESRLLIFNKEKKLFHHYFYELPEFIPEGSLLVRNSSKVLPARFFFNKPTGSQVELLLVEPVEPSNDPQIAIASNSPNIWKVIVGGKRIHKGMIFKQVFTNKNINVKAEVLEKNNDFALVKFDWEPKDSIFSKILNEIGHIPLPPYIKRSDQLIDYSHYQTVYASTPGSVAAPTAGLHFTDKVLKRIKQKNVEFVDVTLHIGPGTFKPIGKDIAEHIMHSEMFCIKKETIERIYQFLINTNNFIFAIGTTSVRTIESLFWLGNKIFNYKNYKLVSNPKISQWEPYQSSPSINPAESLEILLNSMERENIDRIFGTTQLFILPMYKIKFFDSIITNFHLPKSTLLLLIASFVGEYWRKIYDEALNHNYRFLSYGDSSLLWNIGK